MLGVVIHDVIRTQDDTFSFKIITADGPGAVLIVIVLKRNQFADDACQRKPFWLL